MNILLIMLMCFFSFVAVADNEIWIDLTEGVSGIGYIFKGKLETTEQLLKVMSDIKI